MRILLFQVFYFFIGCTTSMVDSTRVCGLPDVESVANMRFQTINAALKAENGMAKSLI